MSAKESEVRALLAVLAEKANKCWENLKAQEVGNLLYGLKRMNSDILETRNLLDAIVPKIAASPEILDAQAIGNSFYGMQNMKSDNPSVLGLLKVMADKVSQSVAELDGQAMGNSLYGLQGMKSDYEEVREVVRAITLKLDTSSLEMNAQELGNALYGLQNMISDYPEVRSLLVALARKVASSKHDLTSQEIGNAIYGLQGMRSDTWETRLLVRQLSIKISRSNALLDPQGIANSLYGFQRMSSESEEVRLLIQALAAKIEQSWKLLNAQHIANSIYGLQNLSSFEIEVSNLIRTLVPKVISCRDDMTSKQISCAFFGLQSMYSHHEDVIALVAALTEKVVLSKDIMTGLQLGSAIFGLQGLNDSIIEVRKLMAAFTTKLSNTNVKDIEPHHLGNCYYGLQRMSTLYPEIVDFLSILSSLVINCDARSLEFNPLVCGNILYGLQNCSWEEACVVQVLLVLAEHMKNFTTKCLASIDYHPALARIAGSSPTNFMIVLDDVLHLYQCLTLAMTCYPNMDANAGLRDTFLQQQALLYRVIEARKHEKTSSLARELTIPQLRLFEGIKILLHSEPYDVASGELLHGFQATVVVNLKSGVNLTLMNCNAWNPVLNIEILGSSHTFPSKDLFTRLRNRYLFEHQGVAVEMIHATMVASGSFGKGPQAKKGMIDTLRAQDTFLQTLYPPTMEDASLFATILFNQGFTGPQGIMSSLLDATTDDLLERYRNRFVDNSISSNSFFALGTLDTSPQSFDGFSGVTSYEYVDDNLENDGLGYPRANAHVPDIRSPFRVMNAYWIGDHPKLSSPMSAGTPRESTPRSSAATTPQSSSSRGSNVFTFASVPSATSRATTTATAGSKLSAAISAAPFVPTSLMKESFNLSAPPPPMMMMPPQQQQQHYQPHSRQASTNASSSISGLDDTSSSSAASRKLRASTIDDGEDATEVDHNDDAVDEIALLEAQLEIARIEAKLLQLKKGRGSSVGSNDKRASGDDSSMSSAGTTNLEGDVPSNK
jgi:hypothetical protein